MKLFFSPASPFVRKVMLAARAAGVNNRIELVHTSLSPIAEDASVNQANPLGKIPALLLEDGSALFDSRVIVQYFDAIGQSPLLPPPGNPARWRSLRLEAVADGICDAAVLMRYETALRPESCRWSDWIDSQWRKIARSLDFIEAEADNLETGPPLDAIAPACALSYLDFRHAERNWRAGRPRLAAFFDRYNERPDMKETASF